MDKKKKVNKIINFIDVGCSCSLPFPWNKNKNYKNIFYFMGFEPNKKFDNKKIKNIFSKSKIYQKGVFDINEEKEIYICKKDHNSSLFEPNNKVLKEYMKTNKMNNRFEIKRKEKIKCVRLDTILNKSNINFDFLKIDTQGADYNVIKSLGKYLETQIIGIHTELFFKEMYKGIALFEKVNKFLNKHKFYIAKKVGKKNKFWRDFLYLRKDRDKKDKINLIKKIYNLK